MFMALKNTTNINIFTFWVNILNLVNTIKFVKHECNVSIENISGFQHHLNLFKFAQ